MICDEAKEMLDRYVDAELTTGEASDFERHLKDCGPCTAEALSRMKLKQMTRSAAMRYRPPAEFRTKMDKLARGGQKPTWRHRWMPSLALGTAALILLAACFVFLWQRSERERAFAELADLHVSALASANPVDVVSTDSHTVKPWFAGRIPFSFNLPELQNTGFTLAGGRVAYVHRTPAAQLLYGLRKHQISVFIFQDQPGAMPISVGGLSASRLAMQMETWSEGGLRYFFIGDAPASDVHALSDLFRKALRN
jgi:anti-sigma factor RsiW